MDEQMMRIAHFLSQYVHCNGGPLPFDDAKVLKDAIAMILKDEVMTVTEMRCEALADYNVIIPWDMIPEEAL